MDSIQLKLTCGYPAHNGKHKLMKAIEKTREVGVAFETTPPQDDGVLYHRTAGKLRIVNIGISVLSTGENIPQFMNALEKNLKSVKGLIL